MKQFIILVATCLVSTLCLADNNLALNSPTKHAPSIKELALAWKNQQYMHAKPQDKKDLQMVYGGADISRRPTLNLHTTVV